MTCLKHYALNTIENSRFHVNVEADERSLREVYLPHFRRGSEAGAGSVMGAYNKFRNDHACEIRHLLTRILRDAWGFEGFTVSNFIYGRSETEHTRPARRAGEQSMVLIQNDAHAPPRPRSARRVLVVGTSAAKENLATPAAVASRPPTLPLPSKASGAIWRGRPPAARQEPPGRPTPTGQESPAAKRRFRFYTARITKSTVPERSRRRSTQ